MYLHVSVLTEHHQAKYNEICTNKKIKYENLYTSILDLTFLLQFYLLQLNRCMKDICVSSLLFEVPLFKIITLNHFSFGIFNLYYVFLNFYSSKL